MLNPFHVLGKGKFFETNLDVLDLEFKVIFVILCWIVKGVVYSKHHV